MKTFLTYSLIFLKLVSDLPILGALLPHFLSVILAAVLFLGCPKCTHFLLLSRFPKVHPIYFHNHHLCHCLFYHHRCHHCRRSLPIRLAITLGDSLFSDLSTARVAPLFSLWVDSCTMPFWRVMTIQQSFQLLLASSKFPWGSDPRPTPVLPFLHGVACLYYEKNTVLDMLFFLWFVSFKAKESLDIWHGSIHFFISYSLIFFKCYCIKTYHKWHQEN